MDISPILLSLKLATVTTCILFTIALPLSHWIAYSKSRMRPLIQTLVALPLVLPPTVLGFYLLLAFSPTSVLGEWLDHAFSLQLAFSFNGLVIASLIYSLPFMVQPLAAGFQQLPAAWREASQLMGKSEMTTTLRVLLPAMKSAVLTGIVLTFASVLGEFGVVLMIGGNIPDRTRVASIALYDEVEALNYGNAHLYAICLLAFSFLVLFLLFSFNRKFMQDLRV